MSDPLDAVDFAYGEWKRQDILNKSDDITVSPQGVGAVRLNEDSLPFLKIAAIRYYLNQCGHDSLGEPHWKSEDL